MEGLRRSSRLTSLISIRISLTSRRRFLSCRMERAPSSPCPWARSKSFKEHLKSLPRSTKALSTKQILTAMIPATGETRRSTQKIWIGTTTTQKTHWGATVHSGHEPLSSLFFFLFLCSSFPSTLSRGAHAFLLLSHIPTHFLPAMRPLYPIASPFPARIVFLFAHVFCFLLCRPETPCNRTVIAFAYQNVLIALPSRGQTRGHAL